MSLILQGKQGLSLSRAQKVSSLLGLKAEETERFCNLVQVKHARSKKNREQARNDLQRNQYQLIDPEETQFVMDWVHSALLEYISINPGEIDSRKLAINLNVKKTRITSALKRLVKMKLVTESGRGYTTESTHTTTTHDVSSEAIRTGHEAILNLARKKLHNTPLLKREFSSLIFSMNSDQISDFKNELRKIRRSLVEKYSTKKTTKTGIYQLSLQFYPITEELL